MNDWELSPGYEQAVATMRGQCAAASILDGIETLQDPDWEHDAECDAAQAKWKKALAAYEAEWPNYCRHCHGTGGFIEKYDPSPPGVSLSPGYMEDGHPCPECTENDKCSRCGGYCPDIENPICPHCGFDWGNAKGAPLQPECWCWEDDIGW